MANGIHHATIKAVAKFGCEIIEANGAFRLLNTETQLLSEDTFDKTGEITEELKRSGIDGIVWETPKAAPGLRSGVMGIHFHKEYSNNPDGPGCNDDLDITLRHETRERDADGKILDTMDLNKLHQIGAETSLFRQTWLGLNPGMQRMNLANRMRGWLRNNPGHLTIGGKTGRFGIEMVEKAAKAKKEPMAKADKTPAKKRATKAMRTGA